MDYNLLVNLQYCKDIVDHLLSFILYSHISSVLVTVTVSSYVFYKTKTLASRILLAIAITFSLWVGLDLIIWLGYDRASTLMTAWSVLGLLSDAIFILVFYFIYVLVFGENMPNWMFVGWGILLLPILFFTSTHFNLTGFDIRNCVALENTTFTNYYYGIGVLVFLLLPVVGYIGWRRSPSTNRGGGIPMAIIGAELFLFAFFTTGVIAQYLVNNGIISDFGLEQYGIMTMAVFMAFLAYVIVKYQQFRIKLIATQALVVAIVILIATEFTFVQNRINHILVGVTFTLAVVTGFLLVRSVKREIAQREQIERLNDEKSEFISFASHEIRTPLTSINGFSSNILEGDYGPISAGLKDAVQKILVRGNDAVALIGQYLNKSKIELGKIEYIYTEFNLVDLVKQVVKSFEPSAEQAKLTITFNADKSSSYLVSADEGKIKEVIGNLLNNAIKYTPTGSIAVSMSRKENKILVKIADTGLGMNETTIGDLFKKFSRGKDAVAHVILGTGLGLYLAKTFIEAHHGRIWAESDGEGKGSTFFVELPGN